MSTIFQPVAKWLDGTAMYRVVTLALISLSVYSIILGFLGKLSYTGTEQLISLVVALAVALLVNYIYSRLFKAHVNMESAVITALIVFFLIIPAQISNLSDSWVIAVVVMLAISSKFLISWRKQHLLNPAAAGGGGFALADWLFSIPGYFESTWWIGRPELFLPLLIVGGAVVYKVRKWTPVISFLLVAFAVFLFEEARFYDYAWSNSYLTSFWLSGPSLFLAFFMLTEPFTLPPTKKLQGVYGAVVGFISQTTLFLSLGIKMTPELALVIGNLLFFPTTLRQKLFLKLESVREIAKHTYEFVFEKPSGLVFLPGQYLEWMLPHVGSDNRGIRRYFTVASAPEENKIRLGVRFGDTISSFKKALRAMKAGDEIIASQRAGDFLLPKETSTKLAFIAGGIGITPFISQIESMAKGVRKYNTVLYYCNNNEEEIAYFDYLKSASAILPLKVVHVLAKEEKPGFETGFVTAQMIKKFTPDYLERTWYLSGPPGMVNAYSTLLVGLCVPRRQIVKDFFPGLA